MLLALVGQFRSVRRMGGDGRAISDTCHSHDTPARDVRAGMVPKRDVDEGFMHQTADSKRGGNRNDPSAPATGYIHETARLMGHPRAFHLFGLFGLFGLFDLFRAFACTYGPIVEPVIECIIPGYRRGRTAAPRMVTCSFATGPYHTQPLHPRHLQEHHLGGVVRRLRRLLPRHRTACP